MGYTPGSKIKGVLELILGEGHYINPTSLFIGLGFYVTECNLKSHKSSCRSIYKHLILHFLSLTLMYVT